MVDSATPAGPRFVNVPVPEEHVLQVMGFIASLQSGGPVATTDTAPADGRTEDARWTQGAVWPVAQLRRLAAGSGETAVLLTGVLDALVSRPGEWLNLTDLAESTGVERDKLKYMWTHVTRHLKKHYQLWWPLDSGWGDVIPVDGQHITYYRLDDAQAQAWRDARGVR